MNFESFLHQGELHAWLFLPIAVLLGAMHGLEPGHSKTMMAGFIIAIRGTVAQAVMLGLSAALSHSAVIWALAVIGLKYGRRWDVEAAEPYVQIGTGVLVAGLALWTILRLIADRRHPHEHRHEVKSLSSKAGPIELWIEENERSARFQMKTEFARKISAAALTIQRPDGSQQVFSLQQNSSEWESTEPIPEPHEFQVEVALRTTEGTISVATTFTEVVRQLESPAAADEPDDAHARAHAEDIKRRFDGRVVTTPQILLFGLTGGLMPCPAALSILLVCLQLKRVALGFTLVAAFGVGLAVTMVTVGVAAAWGAKRISHRSGRLANLGRNAPYFSAILLLLLASFLIGRGIYGLN